MRKETETKNQNYNDLSDSTKNLIKELILEHQKQIEPSGYKNPKDAFEEIEFERRDGFIPNSLNKGGLLWRNFTTLREYYGSGYEPANQKAAKEIERQINYDHEISLKVFKEKFPNEKSDINNDNYYEILSRNLSDDYSSIMHEIRFMYHGVENKKHYASISVALNTEGPYHRSHISWAPNVFCEAAKEVEIRWSNNTELKSKLNKHLKKLINEMF